MKPRLLQGRKVSNSVRKRNAAIRGKQTQANFALDYGESLPRGYQRNPAEWMRLTRAREAKKLYKKRRAKQKV